MTLFQIVALYVALNLLLLVVLFIRVLIVRLPAQISLGEHTRDGVHSDLQVRVRSHGNFVENTPMALLGLIAMAFMGAAPWALHMFGGVYLIARLLHAQGMTRPQATGNGRKIGTVLTLLVHLGQALTLLNLVFTTQIA